MPWSRACAQGWPRTWGGVSPSSVLRWSCSPRSPPLARVSADALVAGVCAGLGAHLGLRVPLVRLALVLLAAISGAGVLFYAALWALTPSGRAPEGSARPGRGERRRGMGLLVLGAA